MTPRPPHAGSTRAALLLLAGLLLATSRPASAQFSRAGDAPTHGVLLPGASTTLDQHAGALEINPAQAGWLRSWHLLLGHTELAPESRFLGTGTGAFFAYRPPLVPLVLSIGAQLLRPSSGFGRRYPDLGKLSLGLALAPRPWISLGLSGHVFVSPNAPGHVNGLTTLDAGLTLRPASWLALAVVARDLTSPHWAGLPLQRVWDFEMGIRPLSSGRLGFALGLQVGERRRDLVPRLVLLGEPWPGLTLFADAAYMRRDLDDSDGVERRPSDVRVTAGVRLDFEQVGFHVGFVGGYHDRPGGAAAGGSAWMRISGAHHRSVTAHRNRILLVDMEKEPDVRHLWRLIATLQRAVREPGVKAVILKLGAAPGWGQAEELRRAVARLRHAGKTVFVYLYATTGTGYYVATAANRILLFPGGGLRFSGLSSRRIYIKALLDKIGVKAQFIKYADYKTAPELFTRTGPSPAAQKVRDALLDEYAARFTAALATRPAIGTAARARTILAQGPFTAAEAKHFGLVDALVWPDKAPRYVFRTLHRRLGIERPARGPRHRTDWGRRPAIAIVAVEGDIVEGKSRTLPIINRRTAGAQSLVKTLAALAGDPRIHAVVLRVESGGGSALGSEAICRVVQQLARTKPVIASLGNVAASGGYFVAAPAAQIFALPGTLTGSIGIFAGKADLSGLLTRLGVTVDIQRRGARADVDSWFRPYTEAERTALHKKLGYYYHRFLDAVAKGRKHAGLGTRSLVEPVAGGRVWTGAQARQRRLVDRLGGLYDAVQEARKRAGLVAGDGHEIIVLPHPPPGLLARAVKLLLPAGSRAAAGRTSPLLRRILQPLQAVPPSFWVSRADTPLARLPYRIEIR